MRQTALRQHLEAEARQKEINREFKGEPVRRGAGVRRRAVIDHHLAAEMAHYNGAPIKDEAHLRSIKAEAPDIFPKREVL
jgi:hypothetical protein